MKSNFQFIEPLEARIAPALLINGGNLLGGQGNPTTGETSTGANQLTLVKVLSGQALVFYNNGTITGISVGQHTTLDITGDVFGDIVTNLGPNGRLTDTDNNPGNGEDGGLLTAYGIKGITTHPLSDEKGSLGRIISGGQIKNVNISGEIAGIYAGDGIFRNGDTAKVDTGSVDFNTVLSGPQHIFTFQKGASVPNGSAGIKNVTVATARQLEIFSGSGLSSDAGPGLPGSSISNVTITKTLSAEGDKPVLFLHAGDGGAGTEGGGGGAGGAITSFNDQGSIAYVKLQTGNGGTSTNGTGGAGGFLQSSTIVSSSTRYDFVLGDGGSGQKGGVGGGIDTLKFTNNITGGKSLIASADFNNDGRADVVLLNTLTGESTVSLGADTAAHQGEANFREVTNQVVTQADGTTILTPFLPAEGANPTSLVVADFNGDGLLDFAVSYASTNSLGLYTNTNNGTFSAERQELAFSPTSIVAGNFGGTGRADLALVSALNFNPVQTGFSSNVYVGHNDGTGHFAVDAAPVATVSGTATVAAGANGTTADANLFIGTKLGNIFPIQFRGGVATVGSSVAAFGAGYPVPVNSLDVVGTGGGDMVLAFSKDINVLLETSGDNSVTPMAFANVFTFDGSGNRTDTHPLTPDPTTVNAHFLAGSGLVGTVGSGSLTIWNLTAASQAYSTVASIGSNGQLQDFATLRLNGSYQFAASGTASNRFYSTSGNPGGADGIKSFLVAETDYRPRIISVVTGNGGDGDSLSGGTGGSVKSFTYTQTLGGGVIEAGGAYTTSLITGHGGNSSGDVGGKGGGIRKADLTMTPGYLTYGDDTTTAVFETGAGGVGSDGGDGGSVKKASFKSVLSEVVGTTINLDSVSVRMLAGDGGEGRSGEGGNGGNIDLVGQASISGVTFIDDDSNQKDNPALFVKGGDGGQGITLGGIGGSLTNVGSQNVLVGGNFAISTTELTGAQVTSGNGGRASSGNGGAGGTITGANVTSARVVPLVRIDGISYYHPDEFLGIDGAVAVTAGNGGAGSGGVGGNGGAIIDSTVGSVSGDANKGYGAFVKAGTGGDGDGGGGLGGSVSKLKVSSPQDSSLYAAVIAAGNGGNALSSGAGGDGGNVQNIKQIKDVNSAINVIQAGNGGRGAGDVGGMGGSVTKVNSVGFIGVPSSNTSPAYYGAFHNGNTTLPAIASLFASGQIPQGIFAGKGADGADNGAVINIVARQIAAIGASVQANGTFAAARLVDGVTTDLVGYDVAQDGTFQSATGQGTSPATSTPRDGFILASEVINVSTIDNDRTARFTFTN